MKLGRGARMTAEPARPWERYIMDRNTSRCRGRGFVPLEMLAVMCVIAILLGLGVVVVSSAREQAHLAQAEGRLRQVGVALDLYFKQHGQYPPAGSDLSEELEPFLKTKEVCENPIGGLGISGVYEGLTQEQLDAAENYITGFYGDDGETMVLLKTMGKVERKTGFTFNPDSHTSAKFAGMSAVAIENQETIETVTDTVIQEGRVVQYKLDCDDKKTGVSIKFEAVGDQLGEDGAEETDRFTLQVNIGANDLLGTEVMVKVKAGTENFVTAIDDNDADGKLTIGDLVGEPKPLVRPDHPGEPTGWSIQVTPEGTVEVLVHFDIAADGTQEHALSHVEIQFPNGDIKILEVLPPQRFD